MSDNLFCRPRELHARSGGGIQVTLWWSPADRRTWVTVRDASAGGGFLLPVHAGERARDVFDHPYAYAARHGIPTIARAA